MKSLTELEGLTVIEKINAISKHCAKRDATALANDHLIMKYFKAIDISDIAVLCQAAGKRSYEYWNKNKGGQQCANSLHSSTAGMYGEAVVERWFQQSGIDVVANWREWIDGVADDTKADMTIGGVVDTRSVEVKTITRATDPKGQVTVKHLDKYVREEKIIVCIRYDEVRHVGYVYAIAESSEVQIKNKRELNLNNDECYVVMPASVMKPTVSEFNISTGEIMTATIDWR